MLSFKMKSVFFWLSVFLASCVVGYPIPGYEPVKDTACKGNDVLGKSPKIVPRVLYNPFLSRTPSDLGDYQWFNCTNASPTELCTFTFDDHTNNVDKKLQSPPPGSPIRYFVGTYIYVALALLIAILVPIATTIVICCWYVTRCCCKHDTCVTFRCGLSHPTRRSTCTPGFRIQSNNKIGYSKLDRFITKFFYLIFLVFIIAVAVAAEFGGNRKLTAGTLSLVDSETGIGSDVANMVRSVTYPASNLVIDLNNLVLVPLLNSATTTISTALNLPASVNTVYCLRDSLLTMGSFTNFDTLVGDLEDQFTGPTGLKGHITIVDNEFAALRANILTLQTQVNNMEVAQTTTWTQEDEDILTATVLAQAAFTPYVAYANDFGVSATGLVQVLESELEQLLPANYPIATDFTDIIGSNTDNTALYNIATGNAFTAADVSGLVSDLTTLHATLSTIDLTTTSTSLTTLSTDISTAPTVFDDAHNTADTLHALLLASTVDIHTNREPFFTDFCTDVGNLAPTAFISAIRDVETALLALTLDPVRDVLLDAYSVLDVLPCVDDVVLIINRVSTQVIEVPAEINNIISDINAFKADVANVENVIRDGTNTLADAQNAIDSLVLDFGNQFTDKIDDLEALDTDLNGLCTPNSFNDLLLNAQNVKTAPTSIGNAAADATALAAYLSAFLNNFETFNQNDFLPFQTDLSTTLNQMQDSIAEYTALAQGYCLLAPATLCSVDADCPGTDTCTLVGQSRCMDTTTTEGTNACSTHTDCASGSVCLGDAVRAEALRQALTSVTTPVDVSAIVTDLSDMQAQFNAAVGTVNSHYANDLNGLLLGYGLSGTALTEILTNVDDQIVAFPTNDIETALNTITGEIDNFDFTQLKADAASFSNSVSSILTPTVMEQVNNAVSFMVVLHDALFQYIPDAVAILTEAHLRSVEATHGLYGIVEEVVNTWIGVYDQVKQALEDDGFNIVALPTIDIMAKIEDFGEYADKLYSIGNYVHTSVASKNGALHYLLTLFLSDPSNTFIDPSYPAKYSLLTDTFGNAYPDNKMCLLTECLERTVETFNTKKVEDWKSIIPNFDLSYYPLLSRETLFRIPLIFPFIVVLFGLLGFLSPLFAKTACGGFCDNPRTQKIPVGCMLGNIVCQLPWMILFSGILFSLSLTTMDVCATGVNIGSNFLASSKDGICHVAQGTGTWENCQYSTTFEVPSSDPLISETIQFDAAVNFPKTYKHILGGCKDGNNPAENEILRLLNSASTQVRTNLDKLSLFYVGTEHGTAPSAAGINLRTPIRQLATSTIDSAGNVVERFLSRIGDANGPLGCDNVHNAVNDALDAVCCGVITPFWWYASAWFLIAWSYLLCGIPAGCKARKRLPTRVWGPGMHALLEREESKRNKAVFLANREAVHEYLRFRKRTDFDYSLLDAESISKESDNGMGRTDNPLSGHTQVEIAMTPILKRNHLNPNLTAPVSVHDPIAPYGGKQQPYSVPMHEPVRISDVPPHLRNEV